MSTHPTISPSGTPAQPDDVTMALAFYAAARAEILERLTLRENTLLAWVTTAGILIGWALKDGTTDPTPLHIAELLPVLSLPFGLAVYRHHLIIQCLGRYLHTHLNRFLGQADDTRRHPNCAHPQHWDNSHILKRRRKHYLALEFLTFIAMLTGLSVLCLAYLWRHGIRLHDRHFWPAAIATAIVVGVGLVDGAQALTHEH
jgi:hypothetical protein